MASVIILVSAAIKAIALLMVVYTFYSLSNRKEPHGAGVLTKYFLVRQRYSLLRMSLIFVAALIAVELASLAYAIAAGTSAVSELSLLFSDIVFLGLVVLLSKIYQVRSRFGPQQETQR